MNKRAGVVVGVVGVAVAGAVLAGCSLPPPQADRGVVGQAAPSFNLPATGTRKIALEDLTKDATAVIVFYRGDW
ncbi:redoxin domain-containing protein [bacterium]|nr:redoxin domain-containing protein [bacterium]